MLWPYSRHQPNNNTPRPWLCPDFDSFLIRSEQAFWGTAVPVPISMRKEVTPLLWCHFCGKLKSTFCSFFLFFALVTVVNKHNQNRWRRYRLPHDGRGFGEKYEFNFAIKNRVVNYLFGGLNFQVEHHLFPRVCHVHYPKISKIVRQTAKDHDLPYLEQMTFFGALGSHLRMLKTFGRA